ncbi:MAG: hypothetical protein KJO31_03040 [Gammaproteobacteria bacterium]|nr:hypothetical protein [Gammaproteobacteria bacterium]
MRAVPIIATSLLLVACGGPVGGPEQQLRQWIADAEAAAEEKDRRKLLSLVSEHYIDARGNDIDEIDRMLRFYFLRQQTVNLATVVDDIVVSGETAADIRVTIGSMGLDQSSIGFDADAYKFHFELENNGDEWLLMGARWARLGDELR